MPIYEPQLTLEEMKKRAITHVCAECGSPLTVAWSPLRNCYTLRCQDLSHNTILRPYNPGPYDIQGFNLFNLKRRRKQMAEEHGNETTKALAPFEGITALSRDQAKFILQTIWPKADEVELVKAAITCASYGLNPLMKHLYLIPFKDTKTQTVSWAQVLGIGATRLIASRKGGFGYVTGPRLMTDEEQESIFGLIDPDNFVAITIVRGEDGLEAPGYGRWPKGKDPYGTDKGNTPQNMAFIRSERQALERRFPGEMPQNIEVMDEKYVPIGLEVANGVITKPPPKPTPTPTTKSQNRLTIPQRDKIWGDAKKMGYTDNDVHLIIKRKMGVKNVDDLTIPQASELIDFIGRGESIPAAEPGEGE